MTILSLSGIKLYRNCINVCYDSKGHLYEIPNYCINPPYKFIESSFDQSFESKKINLKVRFGLKELELEVMDSLTILEVKEKINDRISKDGEIVPIRLFFRGKELKDKHSLHHFSISDESVLLMIIPDLSPKSKSKEERQDVMETIVDTKRND